MADLNAVTENMAELLTNTINMTSIFYDMFLSDVPMDITLKQYNEDNQIVEVVLPNRAKDRNIALTGEGSPEGAQVANIGACYVDTASNTVYFKVQNSGENTGWSIVLTQTGAETYIRNYLSDNNFVTENDVIRYLVNNNYAVKSDITDALSTYKPEITMSAAETSGSITLIDNEGFYVTPTGSMTFVLPTVTNTTRLHSMLVQLNITADFISSSYTIDVGTTTYFDKIAPDFSAAGQFNLIYEYDLTTNNWVCGWMSKGIS